MKKICALLFAAAASFAAAGFCAVPVFCQEKENKTVYLTFDDGPAHTVTPLLLNILAKHNVKASFFVVGDNAAKYPHILKRIYREGHTIGVHCYKHNYKHIYRTCETFKADTEKCIKEIKNILPFCNLRYMRLAGGSFGKNEAYRQVAQNLGLKLVEWNCVNGDTEKKNITASEAFMTVVDTSKGKRRVIVLMHDNKKVTADSLEMIIIYFINKGYTFLKF